VLQIPLARVNAKGLDVIHLSGGVDELEAEPSEHRAPRGRWRCHQASSGVIQRPQATRGGLMIGHLVAFLDGCEPNTSPPGGRLEEASTVCQLNRIRRG
jgi:hypothetical protein